MNHLNKFNESSKNKGLKSNSVVFIKDISKKYDYLDYWLGFDFEDLEFDGEFYLLKSKDFMKSLRNHLSRNVRSGEDLLEDDEVDLDQLKRDIKNLESDLIGIDFVLYTPE